MTVVALLITSHAQSQTESSVFKFCSFSHGPLFFLPRLSVWIILAFMYRLYSLARLPLFCANVLHKAGTGYASISCIMRVRVGLV